MKVSVLVPIYNVEKYLAKCLESLKSQSMSDVEFLCINDGSTDASEDIIKKYCEQDCRFKLISKKNTGYGNSMNAGLMEAKGDYIAIVESDDFVESNMLEVLYKNAVDYDVDIVKSSFFYYSDQGDGSNKKCDSLFGELPMGRVFCPLHHKQIFLILQTIWSSIYSKKFLIENSIMFNETPGASFQDVSFAFQTYACAKKVLLIEDAFYHYRMTNANSSIRQPNKTFCICDELKKIDSFINGKPNEYELRIIASRLGYRVLFENFNSIASPFQYALYLKIIEYLNYYSAEGLLCGELWSEGDVLQVKRILENPNAFFMKVAKEYRDERLDYVNTINKDIYIDALINRLVNSRKVIIYGAGVWGKRVSKYLLMNSARKENLCFAITEKNELVKEVDGIPVNQIGAYNNGFENADVIVSVAEHFQFEIIDILEKCGFKNIIALDKTIREEIISKVETDGNI